MIRIRAVSFDETRFCAFEEHELRFVDKVIDVHIYSPDEVFSGPMPHYFELPYLYTELRFKKGTAPEEANSVDFDCDIPSNYLWLPTEEVIAMPFVDCGAFPSLYESIEHLRAHRPEIP